ncbi:hypothetical protein BgiBS90_024701, partial [Biomphalaria glabrata]
MSGDHSKRHVDKRPKGAQNVAPVSAWMSPVKKHCPFSPGRDVINELDTAMQ